MRGDEEGMHQCGSRGNVKWAFSGKGYHELGQWCVGELRLGEGLTAARGHPILGLAGQVCRSTNVGQPMGHSTVWVV